MDLTETYTTISNVHLTSTKSKQTDLLLNGAAFENILEKTINHLDDRVTETDHIKSLKVRTEQKISSFVPDWVDTDYGYEPDNPRLPTSREVVEAMTGRSVEELYADPNVDYSNISRSANDLLWGPTVHGEDTRDWVKIFQAQDLIETIRSENHKMLGANVDIISDYDANGELVAQHAAILDNQGKMYRLLNEGDDVARDALRNFGVQAEIDVQKLKKKIQISNFNEGIIDMLTSFSNTMSVNSQLANTELTLSIFENTKLA